MNKSLSMRDSCDVTRESRTGHIGSQVPHSAACLDGNTNQNDPVTGTGDASGAAVRSVTGQASFHEAGNISDTIAPYASPHAAWSSGVQAGPATSASVASSDAPTQSYISRVTP